MAQDLKAGDRVRIKDSRFAGDAWIGLEAEVAPRPQGTSTLHDNKTFLRPRGKRPWGEGSFWWPTEHLEKIDPEPKFQIGDRVRKTTTSHFISSHSDFDYAEREAKKGELGTVERLPHSKMESYGVKWDSGTSSAIHPQHLEKVQSVPFKLERGDRVVNIKTGREGEAVLDLVFDVKPPFGKPVPVKAVEEYEEHHPGTYDLIKAEAPW